MVGLVSFGSLSNYPDAANNSNYLEMEILNPVKAGRNQLYTIYRILAKPGILYF